MLSTGICVYVSLNGGQVPWNWSYKCLWATLCGCWNLNSGSLIHSSKVLLTTEPSLRLPASFFFFLRQGDMQPKLTSNSDSLWHWSSASMFHILRLQVRVTVAMLVCVCLFVCLFLCGAEGQAQGFGHVRQAVQLSYSCCLFSPFTFRINLFTCNKKSNLCTSQNCIKINFYYKSFKIRFTHVCMCVGATACVGLREPLSGLSFPLPRLLWIKLRLPGLVAEAFIYLLGHRAIPSKFLYNLFSVTVCFYTYFIAPYA